MTRSWIALAAATVVAVVVVVVVLLFGVIALPEYPSLQSSPDPAIPGTVAFFRAERMDTRCLWTVQASGGEPRRVACEVEGRPLDWSGPAAWTGDGRLALTRWDETGESIAILDPETGALVERIGGQASAEPKEIRPVPAVPAPGADLSRIDRARRADGALVLTGSPQQRVATVSVRTPAGTTQVLRAEGPRDFGFPLANWSPDGRWILVQDSEERLIVMGEDGSNPRVLATDAAEPSWFVPGVQTYTIDPAALRESAGG